MNYLFHPAAEAEHLESVAFYESYQPGLGSSYLAAFEAVMARIVEAPLRYRVERQPNIRRVGIKRFPLHVIYRESGGTVEVLAVAHHRRRPNYWLGRL